MSNVKINREFAPQPAQASWHQLYRVAGACTLLSVAIVLLDMAVSFAGGDAGLGEMSAAAWFAYFQASPFLGLRNLGLFNVINLLLALPLYLALYQLHRATRPAGASLALLLYLLGAAVYIANNRALAFLALSQQYAAAAGEAEQALLASAGAVLLAQAEDFTLGTLLPFLISTLATLLMTVVMLRGGVFRKTTGQIGLIGSAALLVFTISVTLAPATFNLAMLLAMLGGLLMIAWNVLVALALFRPARALRMSLDVPAPQAGD